MTNFVTRRVELIKARELVEELIIDDKGVLTDFYEHLTGTTYKSELTTIIKYIEHFANGNSIGKKVKYLKGVKDGITEYEFITKHLRIYAIQFTSKKIVLFSGIKGRADSSDNIASFRAIKKEYIYFIKISQWKGKN